MASNTLSPQQVHALFDILTHHETYDEIQRFKYPTAIQGYGPPFDTRDDQASTSPILQTLLYRFALQLPGLKDVTPDFWQKRIQAIIEKLGATELSESYDKGTIGSRKTLATAISALLEYPARGVLGGLPKKPKKGSNEVYDLSDPDDVLDGWDHFLQEIIYGDLLDDLFQKVSETDKLEEQSNLVQAGHEFILINLATFLHYTMILSPDGPYLARVMENVHKLVPYSMIRQTLRVGNAATMMNGMVKLLLTKLSVNSITSWIGLTNYSDAGMNLLQQIVSTVIGWDVSELQKQSTKVEKEKEGPSKEHYDSIKDHMNTTRDEREKRRAISQRENKSIVKAIFDDSEVNQPLSEQQHAKSMDYFSIQLSIRDRESLLEILCNQQPDLVTQAIRDGVAAYDPIIRSVHQAVDLSGTMTDFENFMNDLVALSKGKGSSRPASRSSADSRDSKNNGSSKKSIPTVEDFVLLLRKHQGASHRFLHQVAKNGKEVTQKYRDYAKSAAAQFRTRDEINETSNSDIHFGAGDMTSSLQKIYSELSEESRRLVSDALDNYAAYLMALNAASRDRMRSVLSEGHTTSGPGIHLAKWQQLLDSTLITPATAEGPVRTGKDPSVKAKAGVGVEKSGKYLDPNVPTRGVLDNRDIPEPPDVRKVIGFLGTPFHKLVAEKGKELWNS